MTSTRTAASEWGEQPFESQAVEWRSGPWSMVLTPHGIEHLAYGDRVLVPRVFFSVRDECWRTPALPLSYQLPAFEELDDPSDKSTPGGHPNSVRFAGEVVGFPLTVTGAIAPRDSWLLMSFMVASFGDAAVARAGPCVLHEALAPGQLLETGLTGRDTQVAISDRIAARPIASGYTQLKLPIAGDTTLAIVFDGARFEMEDQRNWADSTFKSYCPPLNEPRPIVFKSGERALYSLSFSAEGPIRPLARAAGPATRPHTLDLDRLVEARTVQRLPQIGLTHPGGALPDDALERLASLHPAFIHVLVDLGDNRWVERLREDLSVASALCPQVVATIDCPSDRHDRLAQFAELSAGAVDTAFVFDAGSSITSDRLAEAGRYAFGPCGIQVGAGSRGHFANLNVAGRVPESAQVVAIPLASAAHDDDRRALTTSPASYSAIIDAARTLAGARPLYVGPVGLATTFDSWSPPGSGLEVRRAWDGAHRRHATRFGAAWTIAALAGLAPLGVERVCLAGTTGGRGVGSVGKDGFSPFPLFAAFRALMGLGTTTLKALPAGEPVAGFFDSSRALIAVMDAEPVRLQRGLSEHRNAFRSVLDSFATGNDRAMIVTGPDVVASSSTDQVTD